MIRVVLDANVLVSAALARDPAAPSLRAFDALLDERIEVVGCPALLGEVASVLGRDRLRHYLSIDEARRFVVDLAAVMKLASDPPPPYPAVCRDPDDDYLVALARAALVDALVTGDRDLLELDDIGIAVITPRRVTVAEMAPEIPTGTTGWSSPRRPAASSSSTWRRRRHDLRRRGDRASARARLPWPPDAARHHRAARRRQVDARPGDRR